MPQDKTSVVNDLGLHARAAARLVERANAYESEVLVSCRGKTVNGKSIMGVLMLAAAKGSELSVETEGPDAREALDGVMALIRDGFGEME